MSKQSVITATYQNKAGQPLATIFEGGHNNEQDSGRNLQADQFDEPRVVNGLRINLNNQGGQYMPQEIQEEPEEHAHRSRGGGLLMPSNMDIETARGPLEHDPLDMCADEDLVVRDESQREQIAHIGGGMNDHPQPIIVRNGRNADVQRQNYEDQADNQEYDLEHFSGTFSFAGGNVNYSGRLQSIDPGERDYQLPKRKVIHKNSNTKSGKIRITIKNRPGNGQRTSNQVSPNGTSDASYQQSPIRKDDGMVKFRGSNRQSQRRDVDRQSFGMSRVLRPIAADQGSTSKIVGMQKLVSDNGSQNSKSDVNKKRRAPQSSSLEQPPMDFHHYNRSPTHFSKSINGNPARAFTNGISGKGSHPMSSSLTKNGHNSRAHIERVSHSIDAFSALSNTKRSKDLHDTVRSDENFSNTKRQKVTTVLEVTDSQGSMKKRKKKGSQSKYFNSGLMQRSFDSRHSSQGREIKDAIIGKGKAQQFLKTEGSFFDSNAANQTFGTKILTSDQQLARRKGQQVDSFKSRRFDKKSVGKSPHQLNSQQPGLGEKALPPLKNKPKKFIGVNVELEDNSQMLVNLAFIGHAKRMPPALQSQRRNEPNRLSSKQAVIVEAYNTQTALFQQSIQRKKKKRAGGQPMSTNTRVTVNASPNMMQHSDQDINENSIEMQTSGFGAGPPMQGKFQSSLPPQQRDGLNSSVISGAQEEQKQRIFRGTHGPFGYPGDNYSNQVSRRDYQQAHGRGTVSEDDDSHQFERCQDAEQALSQVRLAAGPSMSRKHDKFVQLMAEEVKEHQYNPPNPPRRNIQASPGYRGNKFISESHYGNDAPQHLSQQRRNIKIAQNSNMPHPMNFNKNQPYQSISSNYYSNDQVHGQVPGMNPQVMQRNHERDYKMQQDRRFISSQTRQRRKESLVRGYGHDQQAMYNDENSSPIGQQVDHGAFFNQTGGFQIHRQQQPLLRPGQSRGGTRSNRGKGRQLASRGMEPTSQFPQADMDEFGPISYAQQREIQIAPMNASPDVQFHRPKVGGRPVDPGDYEIKIMPFNEPLGSGLQDSENKMRRGGMMPDDQSSLVRNSHRPSSKRQSSIAVQKRGFSRGDHEFSGDKRSNADWPSQLLAAAQGNAEHEPVPSMGVNNNKYTFGEQRPQTRGTQSRPGGASTAGTRSRRRSRRLPIS